MSDSADNKTTMQILAEIAAILNKYQLVVVDLSNNINTDGENLLLNCNNVDSNNKKLLLDHLQQNDHFFATALVDNCNPATNNKMKLFYQM